MASAPDASSPWPLLVALGIAVGEVGVLFGLVPVAVGGVVLFGGSAASVLREAGFAQSAWRPLALVGASIGVASLLVWVFQTGAVEPGALRRAAATDGIAVRAVVVLVAAILLLLAGLLGAAVERRRTSA